MIMPNGLMSRQRTMTGAELKETVHAFVEGCEGGFVPFNRGSLPIVSGIAVEVKENNGSYTLTGITRNGQPLGDNDTVTVTCLATEKQMEALLASDSGTSAGEDTWVKNTWRDHVSGGGAALAEPENYMTLGGAEWQTKSVNQNGAAIPGKSGSLLLPLSFCWSCWQSGSACGTSRLCRRPSIRKAPRIWKKCCINPTIC